MDLDILKDEKELGEFIKKFKVWIWDKYESWNDWLDESSSEQVDKQIILFNNFK